jgi:CHASE3 domain sensor protein
MARVMAVIRQAVAIAVACGSIMLNVGRSPASSHHAESNLMSTNEIVVVQQSSAPPRRFALSADVALIALGLLILLLLLGITSPPLTSDMADRAAWISHAD